MKKRKYITLTRKVLEYSHTDPKEYIGYHYEFMNISPEVIMFYSQQPPSEHTKYCTRLQLVNGDEVLVKEDLSKIEVMLEKYFKEKEKDNTDKIVISKDDIVKNFLFKNM